MTFGQLGKFGGMNETILLKIGITKSLSVTAVDTAVIRIGGH